MSIETRTITAVIRNLLETEAAGGDPQDINDGDCEWFAHMVAEVVRGSRVLTDDMIVKATEGGTHYFVEYGGLFYDAEAPEGVADWGLLPYFIRQRRLLFETMKYRRAWRAAGSGLVVNEGAAPNGGSS